MWPKPNMAQGGNPPPAESTKGYGFGIESRSWDAGYKSEPLADVMGYNQRKVKVFLCDDPHDVHTVL